MNANPVLLQKKYARIVGQFAREAGVTMDEALGIFYRSAVYGLMRDGVSDMHCMSDGYLVECLGDEWRERQGKLFSHVQ